MTVADPGCPCTTLMLFQCKTFQQLAHMEGRVSESYVANPTSTGVAVDNRQSEADLPASEANAQHACRRWCRKRRLS